MNSERFAGESAPRSTRHRHPGMPPVPPPVLSPTPMPPVLNSRTVMIIGRCRVCHCTSLSLWGGHPNRAGEWDATGACDFREGTWVGAGAGRRPRRKGTPWMQVMVTRARGAHAPSPSSGAAATSTLTSTATTPASSCPAGGSSTSGDWPRGADSGPAFNLVTVSECVPGEGSDWGISSGILTTLLPIKEHEIQIVFFIQAIRLPASELHLEILLNRPVNFLIRPLTL